jgi:hypothetical protein
MFMKFGAFRTENAFPFLQCSCYHGAISLRSLCSAVILCVHTLFILCHSALKMEAAHISEVAVTLPTSTWREDSRPEPISGDSINGPLLT